MESIGINLVHKAQNSVLRRWFPKQKLPAAQVEDTTTEAKDEAGLRSDPEQEEVSLWEGFDNREDQLPLAHGEVAHVDRQKLESAPTKQTSIQLASGSADQHRESSDEQPVPGKQSPFDDLPFGEDVLIGEVHAHDFTESLGGIVIGFDGTKKCPVLVLTHDISTNVQEMIRFERMVRKQEREAKANLEGLSNFQATLAREIRNHQRLITESGDAGLGSKALDAEVEDEPNRRENLQEELENLGRLSKGIENRKSTIEANLRSRRNRLQAYQAELNEHLEMVFIYSQAIEEASDEEDFEVPEISMQEEYQNLVAKMQEFHSGPFIPKPLTITDDTGVHESHDTADDTEEYLPPTLSPEKQARMEASRSLWEAQENLQYARVQFSEKEEQRGRDLQQNIEAEQRGEPVADASVEAFDLRWVIRFQEITHELLNAEIELSKARAHAKEIGLPLEHDNQSSCFPDHAADGGLELMSNDIDTPETFAGDPRMIAWMDSLVDSVDPDFSDPMEVDDWGSGEEVEISDSASVVAQGSERRRIDAWQQVCQTISH